jgi:hypothetical protein
MRRLVIAGLALIALVAATPAATIAPAAMAFDAANDAWERGDYITALNGYIGLLNAPGGERFLEPIALTTGELFETRELTSDGRAPRFSPDGRFLVYETGLETSRRTKVLKNDATRAEVADLPGVSATFSPLMAQVAYLRIPDHEEIRRASQALAAAPLTARNRNQLTQTLTWLIAKHAAIVVRDLGTGREMELPAPDLLKTGLIFSADGRLLYFLGGTESEPDRTDLYVISESAPRPAIVAQADGLKGAPMVDPSGKVLIYVIPTVSPLRRPFANTGESAGAGGAGGQTGVRPGGAGQDAGVQGAMVQSASDQDAGGGRGGARPSTTFAIVNLAARKVSVVAGTAPVLSGDGRTLAYIARSGPDYSIMVGSTTGLQTEIKRTPWRLDAPALSPDGRRVAYQAMVRDDWEIFIADGGGTGERQLTREIQHDLLPRFITPDRLFAVMGEARHRRSYLYDLGSASDGHLMRTWSTPDRDLMRSRVFHNNTVRTIAPEYQWAVSPDGTQILIGAERDGNTVSPARGVYAVDLRQKVTKAAVLTRLHANLKTETALKAAGTRAFQPIAAQVRRVISGASEARVFGYEKTLFDFDSKHISKPGNRLAAEYLFNTYTSFGYSPEYQWFDPSTLRPFESLRVAPSQVEGRDGRPEQGRGATRPSVSPSSSREEPRAALDGKTANVIATLRGTVNPELVYLVSSHFDSVEAGPGADDDTSGTAALLEAARVLAGHPMPATIVFASFTGEEGGLLGSREFVRRALAAKMKVVGALNNDMIGWTNDHRLDNTIRYSNPGIRDIQHAAAMLFTRLITYDALYFKGTDAVSLYDGYGDVIGGIGSYPVLASPYYHQASDLLEHENHQLITETSKTTVATVMLLASSPSRLTNLKVDSYTACPPKPGAGPVCAGEGGAAALSWTPAPEAGITSYIVAYGTAADPLRHRIVVTQPRAMLPSIAAGTVVSVKAVNARGLEGWDWAKVVVGAPAPTSTSPTAVSGAARQGIR